MWTEDIHHTSINIFFYGYLAVLDIYRFPHPPGRPSFSLTPVDKNRLPGSVLDPYF